MTKQTILTPAEIVWKLDTPHSVSFDDFYFSSDDGINESRYVFLQPNNLPARFSERDINRPFIIAETGFGTGLNFLLAWQAWANHDQAKRPLHFFSIEKYPLKKEDLAKSLSLWPELSSFTDQLIKTYPALVAGLHTLEFDQGKVRLSLVFGDITTDLNHHQFTADAWYLDGFSPKKNPEMWTTRFFKQIAERSSLGTTFATFSSASEVRKALLKEGFIVKKQSGFGKKREMLFGYLDASNHTPSHTKQKRWSLSSPDDSYTKLNSFNQGSAASDVAIIGAGLAGISTAYELTRQGLKVSLLEKNSQAVSGASGQSQLAMYAKFPSEPNKLFHFILHALVSSIAYYQRIRSELHFTKSHDFWNPTGLLQLAWNDKEQIKQTRFLENIQLPQALIRSVSDVEASHLSGLTLDAGGLWFEQAGWLDPVKYAKVITHATNLECLYQHTVESLVYDHEQSLWNVYHTRSDQPVRAKYVVIANANDAKTLPQVAHLPFKPLRGQVTSLQHHSLQASKTVVCGEGYLCPPINSWHHFGATFDLKCHEAIIKTEDTQENIAGIQSWLPGWLKLEAIKEGKYQHSAGLRCTTPDYLPIAGPAPIAEKMIEDFAKLRVDSNACKELYGTYYPNLFINLGHGSKGLFTTPLAAQLIRYHICGGLPPCSEEHRLMLSPARFIIKHLSQRRL